jgi:hypothetical protein
VRFVYRARLAGCRKKDGRELIARAEQAATSYTLLCTIREHASMKLNFWQYLGILLLIAGALVYAWDKGYLGSSGTATTAPAVKY